jgi:ribosomal protein S18 acetylase RimI-like enzyme
MESTVTLRPVTPGDEEFLYQVYASTRAGEMVLVDWTPEQKDAFLRMQFRAQSQYYREHYVGASFQMILLGDGPVGRLYVARWEREIRIMDIALLPEYCGRGIGSALLRTLLAEGQATGRRVSIHVECNNPALRLYTRLGFRHVGDHGIYYLMEWSGNADTCSPAAGAAGPGMSPEGAEH